MRINDWSKTNLFEINCGKTKELTISFSCQCPRFPRKYTYYLYLSDVMYVSLFSFKMDSVTV